MIHIKCSPSRLESVRLYYSSEYGDYITMENIIDNIKGVKVYKPEMEFGKALHAIVEHGVEKYTVDNDKVVVKEDDMQEEMSFDLDSLEPVIQFRREHPMLISEMWNKYHIDTFFNGYWYRVHFNMKLDGLEGIILHEHKTTSKSVKHDSYERSVQWKVYMEAAGVDTVQYNIFEYKKGRGKKAKLQIFPVSFQFHRYPDLKKDIVHHLGYFISFLEQHKLFDHVLCNEFGYKEKPETT